MPVTSATTIDHRAEITKMFASLRAALGSNSKFAYELPSQLKGGVELSVTASDEELIQEFESERSSTAHDLVAQKKQEIEGVFNNGAGDSQTNRDKIKAAFEDVRKKSNAFIDDSEAKALAKLDALSTQAGKDKFTAIIGTWLPVIGPFLGVLVGVVQAAVDWLVQAVKDALDWIGARATELWSTIKGWFGGRLLQA